MVSGGRVAPLVSSRIVKIRVLDNGILRVLLGPSVDSEHHRYKQALFAPLVSSCLAPETMVSEGSRVGLPDDPRLYRPKVAISRLSNPCKSL